MPRSASSCAWQSIPSATLGGAAPRPQYGAVRIHRPGACQQPTVRLDTSRCILASEAGPFCVRRAGVPLREHVRGLRRELGQLGVRGHDVRKELRLSCPGFYGSARKGRHETFARCGDGPTDERSCCTRGAGTSGRRLGRTARLLLLALVVDPSDRVDALSCIRTHELPPLGMVKCRCLVARDHGRLATVLPAADLTAADDQTSRGTNDGVGHPGCGDGRVARQRPVHSRSH